MSTPPQQPWARSAPSPLPPPVQGPTPRRSFLATPLGLFLMLVAFVTLLGVTALIYVLINRNQTLKVNIPTPKMPTPNAFDIYVKAGKEIVREEDIDVAVSSEPKRRLTLAEKTALLAANQRALTAFRSGFGLPYSDRPVRSVNQLLPYYKDFRNGARLMRLEGQVKRETGDAGGAAASGLDAVEFGRQISVGASAIGGLVSAACQAIGRRVVWDSRADLTASQTKAAARRIERINQTGATPAEIFTEEKYVTQAATLELFRDPEGFAKTINQPEASDQTTPSDKTAVSDKTAEDAENSGISAADWRFVFLLYGKRRLFDNMTRYMDAAIAQAEKRYGSDHAPIPEPDDPLSLTMIPVMSQNRFKFVLTDTQNALLAVDLALRAYKGERGRYPSTMNALCPAYLSRPPDDPFAAAGPLRYRRTPNGFILYSIGPDGKDDNGKPIESADGKTLRAKRQTKEDSLGDIVAGVNQ